MLRTTLLLLALAGLALALPRSANVASNGAAGEQWQRVELIALAPPDGVEHYLRAHGAVVELRSHDRIQALVPASLMEALRASSLVRVAAPVPLVALEVASAIELIGADRWRAAGFTGRGVRVAVIDAGFAGYGEQLGEALPERVRTRSFRADGSLANGTDHGTRAAQVVYRVAPGAELYLLNFGTVTELSAAVDFVVEQGIDVVSFSLGFLHSGPGDGTGAVDEIVTRGADGAALWAVAAGNWAQQHWSGQFVDSDGDSIHEFAPGVTQNSRAFQAGDLIVVSLRWDDDWGAACSDYDLELFGPDGSLVQASRQIQDCDGDPVESIQVLATQDGSYAVRIVQASAVEPRQLDLMVVGSPGRGEELDRFVAQGSLSEPADHAAVITVGAVTAIEPLSVELFSSRGPTADGRAKPEIASPTGIVGALEGGGVFVGTSAAAPHVAGLLALLMEAFPDAGSDEIRAHLASRAVDLPPDGADGASGDGLANLGSLSGLGLLLPVGAEEARLIGELPPDAGLAIVIYRGPDGYPLRFAHLLTGGRDALAWFRLDLEARRWDHYIAGAPGFASSFDRLEDGDVLVTRLAAPEVEGIEALNAR